MVSVIAPASLSVGATPRTPQREIVPSCLPGCPTRPGALVDGVQPSGTVRRARSTFSLRDEGLYWEGSGQCLVLRPGGDGDRVNIGGDAPDDVVKTASPTLAYLRALDKKMDLVLEAEARLLSVWGGGSAALTKSGATWPRPRAISCSSETVFYPHRRTCLRFHIAWGRRPYPPLRTQFRQPAPRPVQNRNSGLSGMPPKSGDRHRRDHQDQEQHAGPF